MSEPKDPVAVGIMIIISICAVQISATNLQWLARTVQNHFAVSQPFRD